MGEVAITADALSKRYRLGSGAHHYGRLTESLSNAFSAPFRRLSRRHPASSGDSPEEQFVWALKDVSFKIREGEAVGIIGRNGAGKTTLLKVLSRITQPTEGRAVLRGRVGSLLEVGTGFHPELTGRENVYLNGAILGMSRADIAERFDEIVEFAEVGRFLDTPVKRYSSGMQVRLAFAVAAHLEPEILIVDEVLAVGDVAFQRKSLGKMGDVAGEGRTVLFVSHNMSIVTRLCDRGIWLELGHIAGQGPMERVVGQYMGSSAAVDARYEASDLTTAPGNDVIRLRSVTIRDSSGRTVSSVDARHSVFIEIEYAVLQRRPVRTAIRLASAEGAVLFTSTDADDEERYGRQREPGFYVSRCEIPSRLLKRGLYFVSISSSIPMVQVNFVCENLVTFSVDQTDGLLDDNRIGLIAPALPWHVERISDGRGERAAPCTDVHGSSAID
jgi:lipopolysaccharide transport system ATP-binding protein